MSGPTAPEKMDELLYQKYALEYPMLNHPLHRDFTCRLGTVDYSTDMSEEIVRLLIRGINDTNAHGGDLHPIVHPVGRIELFGNWHDEALHDQLTDRGLMLFDVHHRPLIYVVNALIGYGGAGPLLTKAILSELAVPDQIFAEIQDEFHEVLSTNTHYYAVIQSTRNPSGLLEWHWSRVR